MNKRNLLLQNSSIDRALIWVEIFKYLTKRLKNVVYGD